MGPIKTGAPNSGCGPVPGHALLGTKAAQQEVSEASSATPRHSHHLLNHPTPRSHRSAEKLSSTKPIPGVKKVGDRCIKRKSVVLTH